MRLHQMMKLICVLALALPWLGVLAFAQEPKDSVVIDGRPHPPQQVMDLLFRSTIDYAVDVVSDSAFYMDTAGTKQPLSSPDWYRIENGGTIRLQLRTLPDKLMKEFNKGEKAYQKHEYKKALKTYRDVFKNAPEITHLLAMIADAYYMMEQYDSAIFYFESAIQQNLADYQAHWFLADALRQVGQNERALHAMTLAHVLNPNHEKLRDVLAAFRSEIGLPWITWSFCPKYKLQYDGHTVAVTCTKQSMGYALAKALWTYEPGYAEAMMNGRSRDTTYFNSIEEKEAIGMLIGAKEAPERLERIINDGYLPEFMFYEVIGPKYPQAIAMLPADQLDRIVEYVRRYH